MARSVNACYRGSDSEASTGQDIRDLKILISTFSELQCPNESKAHLHDHLRRTLSMFFARFCTCMMQQHCGSTRTDSVSISPFVRLSIRSFVSFCMSICLLCVYLCVSLSIPLSVHLFVCCLSVCLSVCLFVCLPVGLSVCLCVHVSTCRSVSQGVCRTFCMPLFVYLFVCLLACPFVCLCVAKIYLVP